MKRKAIQIWAVLLFLGIGVPAFAQNIPTVKAKTLDDTEIELPKPGSQQALILVLGFSHKSAETCSPWSKRLASDFHGDTTVMYYQIPVLQDAPSFVRPMILHGMRKDIATTEHSHVLPVYNNESDWKKLVGFAGADEAYIVVADASGHVLWQTHGPMNDAAYGELKSALAKLKAK